MGHNPSRNPFKRSQLGIDDQQAVDAYKTASIWGTWWQLDESTRRRYFSSDERTFIRRYGARLDELACLRCEPVSDDEKHFVQVCTGHGEARTARERLWLHVQLVCRYERSLQRAARTDLAEHRAAAAEGEARHLRVALRDAEEAAMEVIRDYQVATGEAYELRRRSICNVAWTSWRFLSSEPPSGPPPLRPLVSIARRGPPGQLFPPYPTRVSQ